MSQLLVLSQFSGWNDHVVCSVVYKVKHQNCDVFRPYFLKVVCWSMRPWLITLFKASIWQRDCCRVDRDTHLWYRRSSQLVSVNSFHHPSRNGYLFWLWRRVRQQSERLKSVCHMLCLRWTWSVIPINPPAT